ncbi:MAG: hypothetical protein EBZ77_01220 [Chitinophagia bacterium]|nr:hypothetical protein [Chitinophagia bacterium]
MYKIPLLAIILLAITCSATAQTAVSMSDSLIKSAHTLHGDSERVHYLLKSVTKNSIIADSADIKRTLEAARKIAGPTRNKHLLFLVYSKLSYYNKFLSNWTTADRYLDSCEQIAAKNDDSSLYILTINSRANLYEQSRDYANAIKQYHQLLKYRPPADIAMGTYGELAALYFNLGDYQHALTYDNESYHLLDSQMHSTPSKIDDTLQLLGLLIDIGKMKLLLHQGQDAQQKFTQAAHLAGLVQQPELAYTARLFSIGILEEQQQYKAAIAQYKALLTEYAVQIHYASRLLGYYHLANAYCQNHEPDAAITFAEKALDTSNERNNSRALLLLGRIYLQQHNPKKSQAYLEHALRLAQMNQELPLSVDIYESLAAAYDSLAMPQKALDAYRMHMMLNDSLYSKEKSNALIKLSLQQDFDRKQITDSLRQASNYDLKMQRQQLVTNGGFGGLVLVLLLSFFIYRNYQAERKYSALLLQAKELQELKLERQSNLLTHIAYTQSHHLRGPLTTLMGLISILNTEDPTDPHNQQILQDIVMVAHRLDDIVKEIVKNENHVNLSNKDA